MYYRHLYATLAQPTLEQRRKSWENYVRLFNIMLNTQVNMQVSPACFRQHHPAQAHNALPLASARLHPMHANSLQAHTIRVSILSMHALLVGLVAPKQYDC